MHRLGQFFVILSLLALLLLGKAGNPTVLRLQSHLADAVVPVLSVASAPLNALRHAETGALNWLQTYQQNEQLKAENRDLLQWQARAKELQVENERLRALLHVAPRPESHFVTASIVSDHGSAFSSGALVNAGENAAIAADQAVISERGLVGRVLHVGKHSAQILLLTDINSRIPVMNERTREKMILVGKGPDFPVLNYVSANSAIRKGDRLITSGDGGVFPKNIAVGTVRDISKSGISVELFAHIDDIEYVSIIAD